MTSKQLPTWRRSWPRQDVHVKIISAAKHEQTGGGVEIRTRNTRRIEALSDAAASCAQEKVLVLVGT